MHEVYQKSGISRAKAQRRKSLPRYSEASFASLRLCARKSKLIYGSPSPFLPFFFAGSASRGRVVGGGGASTFGVVTSGSGCGLTEPPSALGGGGSVTWSRLGSLGPAGNASSSPGLAAWAANSARSPASSPG